GPFKIDKMPRRNALQSSECRRRARHHVEIEVVVDGLWINLAPYRWMLQDDVARRSEHDALFCQRVDEIAHAHAVDGKNHPSALDVDQRQGVVTVEIRQRVDVSLGEGFDEQRGDVGDFPLAAIRRTPKWMAVKRRDEAACADQAGAMGETAHRKREARASMP